MTLASQNTIFVTHITLLYTNYHQVSFSIKLNSYQHFDIFKTLFDINKYVIKILIHFRKDFK